MNSNCANRFWIWFAFIAFPFLIEAQNDSVQIRRWQAQSHVTWRPCFVILLKGDTVRGKIARMNDYSAWAPSFETRKFVVARADNTEQVISINDLRELWLPGEDTEYRRYISVNEDEDIPNGDRDLYRVIIDGKCQFLCRVYPGSNGVQVVDAYGHWVTVDASPQYVAYYFYCNKHLFKTRPTQNTAMFFAKRCKELFADDPSLVKEIKDGAYNNDQLIDIVIDYNHYTMGEARY